MCASLTDDYLTIGITVGRAAAVGQGACGYTLFALIRPDTAVNIVVFIQWTNVRFYTGLLRCD